MLFRLGFYMKRGFLNVRAANPRHKNIEVAKNVFGTAQLRFYSHLRINSTNSKFITIWYIIVIGAN